MMNAVAGSHSNKEDQLAHQNLTAEVSQRQGIGTFAWTRDVHINEIKHSKMNPKKNNSNWWPFSNPGEFNCKTFNFTRRNTPLFLSTTSALLHTCSRLQLTYSSLNGRAKPRHDLGWIFSRLMQSRILISLSHSTSHCLADEDKKKKQNWGWFITGSSASS